MKDAPAFDFYPERFWFAVEGWSESDICRYWRLLGQQWMRGALPADERELAALARGKISARLLEKFPLGEDGLRRNGFLEKMRDEQRERISNAREKGRRMAAGRWKKDDAYSNAHAMHKQCTSNAYSNAHAMHTAMHDECPPLTTHPSPQNTASLSLSETRKHQQPETPERRETERFGSAVGDKAAAIVRLYPANGNRYEAQAAIVRAIQAGESAEAIEAKVKAHAERFTALHPSQRRFCPGLACYFAEGRWNDDPAGHPWTVAVPLTKEQEQRAAVKAAAVRIEKPKISTLRAVDPTQRPCASEFASAKAALMAGRESGDGANQDRREEGLFPLV